MTYIHVSLIQENTFAGILQEQVREPFTFMKIVITILFKLISMTDYGLVSIQLHHNSSKFIAKTIESILLQTYTNWELLITDDCLTDNFVKSLKVMSKDKRIKFFRLEKLRCWCST